MDLNNNLDTHKNSIDSESKKYFYDVEKKLYNIAVNCMLHPKQVSMEDEVSGLTGKN